MHSPCLQISHVKPFYALVCACYEGAVKTERSAFDGQVRGGSRTSGKGVLMYKGVCVGGGGGSLYQYLMKMK